MRFFNSAPIILFALSSGSLLAADSRVVSGFGVQTCTPNEKWTWNQNADPEKAQLDSKWVSQFESSISPQSSKVQAFSEAFALRRIAKNAQEQAFAEYWMSRTLFSAGLVHLSEKGFSSLLERSPDLTLMPYQVAALGCLVTMHRRYSGIQIDRKHIGNIVQLKHLADEVSSEFGSEFQIAQQSLLQASLFLFLDGVKPSQELLTLLKGSNAYEDLALASLHSSQERYQEALIELDRFYENSKGIDIFKPYLDRTHILYGRAAYALGNYAIAIQHYQAIRTHSNEWIHGLSELSWSYLMAERYREAIGTAIGLQSGTLKKTFAPEALMVMAMSLNEMCRFPESMNVIQSFKRSYKDSYFWLKELHASNSALSGDFYRNAVEFAKRSPTSKVPPPVASEWIRSGVFLSNQERINLVFKEKELTNHLSLRGKSEQVAMAGKLLTETKGILKKIKLERIKSAPGQGLSQGIVNEIEHLKLGMLRYRHMKNAGPIWRRMLANYQARVPKIQTEMVKGINTEIASLNRRMFSQLEEIAENNELIEVEILNGASEDMIWKNAHPGFLDAVKKMKLSENQAQRADRVWNWGTTQGGLDGRGEIWEDEIGSLKADLYDNCESKDKYLAVGG